MSRDVKTALVTGSAGFVGSHFVKRLTDEGYKVTGLDVVSGHDCRDYFRRAVLSFDLVIHCAAIVGGREQIDGAPMAVAENLSIDAALWQWAIRTQPGRVVYFSSSAAYPVALQTGGDHEVRVAEEADPIMVVAAGKPLTEDDIDLADIQQPDQTYGLAKLAGEVQAQLVRGEGVPVTVIRPFSGYGPGQTLDYPFPTFIDRAARQSDPFIIWGDGEQTRDFVHIFDIVELVMRCVLHEVDGPVNACVGRPVTFNELATIACREAGYTPEIEYLADKPTGVRYRVGDPSLMHQIWRPQIPLEEGVRQAMIPYVAGEVV
jgi:nucleoside-diphosphate-sugar epimerase